MTEKKLMTEEELMAAELSMLSVEDMTRRSMMINIRKAEREMEMISNENETFQIKKQERIRMREVQIENARQQKDKIDQEQNGCAHKSGGSGLTGILNGDGKLYGSSVPGLILPTGELYFLCFRCQKEWHHPKWTGGMRKVIRAEMTLEEYRKQEREYEEVKRWPRGTFEPLYGEFCSASTFDIPALQAKQSKDTVDFEKYCREYKQ